jgi:hypothetical protein
MQLSRGKLLGYNFDLKTIEFTMFDGATGVRCAVETTAMDDFEEPYPPKISVVADLVPVRTRQFARLRDHIERNASRKYFTGALENDRTVLLRRNDLRE